MRVLVSGRGSLPCPTAARLSGQDELRTSRGEVRELPLEPQTVADFDDRVIGLLNGIGVAVVIHEMPKEVPNPIPFSQDRTHAAYDPVAAHRFWRAVQADRS